MNNAKTLVFLDLSLDALQKKRVLKPIVQKLLQHNLKFWWITPLKIAVRYQGKDYTSWDGNSGYQLLCALKINIQPDEEMTKDKHSNKCKFYSPISPFKGSKIPVKLMRGK